MPKTYREKKIQIKEPQNRNEPWSQNKNERKQIMKRFFLEKNCFCTQLNHLAKHRKFFFINGNE